MYEEKEIKYIKRKKKKKQNQKRKRTKRINKKQPRITNNSFLNKINWKMLFTKLAILIIIMVLIIFTISRINKNNQERNYVINKNINEISKASLSLFTSEAPLKNIGDSTSLLLDEMINNKLLKEVKDKNGKTCDYINSYIIITKTKQKEYRLKIYLKCNKEEKTVEKTIICEDNCSIK